jgi:gas vesicle protein
MSKKSSLGAFLGGYAAGVVTGILVAPKSGKETRKDLLEYANKISDEVVIQSEKLMKNEKIDGAVNATKEQFVKLKDSSSSKMDAIRDYANNKLNVKNKGFTKMDADLEGALEDQDAKLESEIEKIINSAAIDLPNSGDDELKRIIENINRR